jgi:hypothetical protein
MANVYTTLSNAVWYTDKCEITTTTEPVTVQVYATALGTLSAAGNIYSEPPQLDAGAVHQLYVGVGNYITVTGSGYTAQEIGTQSSAQAGVGNFVENLTPPVPPPPLTVVSFTTTETTTWTAPAGVSSVEYLVVGGGAGGGTGYDSGGGGGGGGGMVLTGILAVIPGETYTVTVGAGGAGGPDERINISGNPGSDSVFATVTALGGGAGQGSRTFTPTARFTGGAAQVNAIAAPLGGGGGGGGGAGGGGGGAGGAGGTSVSASSAGTGGAGVASSITGSSVTYGAGGRGGTANVNNNDGAAGDNNTGTGGGAGSATGSNSGAGGNGGSGIVVLKFGT